MRWGPLLSSARLRGRPPTSEVEARNEFERDYDRILFSAPFRRLMDKTQVFPMPENDQVHNRLIHSLEVASIGRSIARLVGRSPAPSRDAAHSALLGDVVAAACLMHDIGNPPFGHAGEDAIGSWFSAPGNAHLLTRLSPEQRADLGHFEGNAQSFRIVARLTMYSDEGGMRLTRATLGAAAKYPRSVHRCPRQGHVAYKKFNYFGDDAALFAEVAEGLELEPRGEGAWTRHPLTYLVEAADDICYHVMDFEDGYTLRLVDAASIRTALAQIIGRPDYAQVDAGGGGRAISALRAMAISTLVRQVAEAFCEHEESILAGELERPLTDLIPAAGALESIIRQSVELCYRAPEVLRVELAGYEVLGGLLDLLVPAVLAEPEARSKRDTKLLILLHLEPRVEHCAYRRVLAVTDFLSAMTDRSAVRLFRELRGMAFVGARGTD